MPPRQVSPINLEALVHHMFDQVLDRQKDVTEQARDDLAEARRKLKAIRVVVAAAEVVVGLAIIMAIFRTRRSASVDEANLLKY